MTESRELLLLVDANNLLMRAVKALERTGTSMTAGGQNTGPLVLFAQMLTKYVRQVAPDRVAVCFDGGRSIRRVAIYPEYKAHRAPRVHDPETGLDPFELAKEWLSLSGIFHIERKGYEADDLIGAYWRLCNRMRQVILTGDKDLLQLVCDDVTMLAPAPTRYVDDKVWTVETVREAMGCDPHEIPLMKAMVGDPSDNIQGVRGIGPGRAVTHGNNAGWDIDVLVGIPRLQEHEDVIRRNLALIDLRNVIGIDLPEPPPLSPTMPHSVAWEPLMQFYERYRMDTLKTRAPTMWKE